MSKRSELRKEWFEVDERRRVAKKGSSERSLLTKRLHKIETEIAIIGQDIEKNIQIAEDFLFERTASVFEGSVMCHVNTSHGSAIGEGCYWNKTGHY